MSRVTYSLTGFGLGFLITASAFIGYGGPVSATPRCLYTVETPAAAASWQAYYGLEDAQNALRALGVDPANTPVGYDITSQAGC